MIGANASAQELPGTTPLPPAVRSPYEEQRVPPPLRPPPAVPRRIEPPTFVLVPDLRLSTGYSDNIFITPDVLGSRAISDGVVTASPRLRALVRVTPEIGLVGDYSLRGQQFFAHGYALQNTGQLFLGYRPTISDHAELGVRGGTAHVSEFAQSNTDEGHVFVAGTYQWLPAATFSVSGSIGLREFPDRTRTDTQSLFLGIGPIVLPVPIGTTTVVRKGEEDVVANVGAGLLASYSRTGALRLAYDFTSNNAGFSDLDFDFHRVGVDAVNVWTSWLQSQLSYSIGFRRFAHASADSAGARRDDTLHDVAVALLFTPAALRKPWFLRSGTIHVGYDWLLDSANISSAGFHRNLVSVGIDFGLIPLTGEQIGRFVYPSLYGEPPSVSTSSRAQ